MVTNTTLFVRACSLRKKLWKDIIKKHISRISNSNAFNNRKNNLLKSKANEWSRLSKVNNQRNLSMSQGKITPRLKSTILVSEEENREFMAVFPDILRHLIDTNEISDIPEARQWYQHVLQENVPNGLHLISQMLIVIYKALENPNNLTPENIRLANILGWCVELNDFSDCFGDPEETGKIGSDIQEGKCSWLVVVALQKATSSQKKVIEENYGKQDPNAVAAIKNLYEELGLPNTYAKYKEDSYNLIKTHMQQATKYLPHALFFKYINELKRRE